MNLFNSINVDSVDSVGFLEPVYGCVYVLATVDWIPLIEGSCDLLIWTLKVVQSVTIQISNV
jgi:hypothetical protein